MKKFLLTLFTALLAVSFTEPLYAFSFGESPERRAPTDDDQEVDFSCTLTISGYGNVEGIGRIPITLSATEATCAEAAARLRPQIIAMKLCNHTEVH